MDGPGKLLGYRALHKKLRQVHELNVPRDVVYAVMYNVDPVALEERAPQYVQQENIVDKSLDEQQRPQYHRQILS